MVQGTSNINPMALMMPIGTIHISTNSANPSTYFGFGTWTAYGNGRAIVGVDTSQTDFNTVRKTGGSKDVTLDTNQMPSHTHTIANTTALTGRVRIRTTWNTDVEDLAGIVTKSNPGNGTHVGAVQDARAMTTLNFNANHNHTPANSGGGEVTQIFNPTSPHTCGNELHKAVVQ